MYVREGQRKEGLTKWLRRTGKNESGGRIEKEEEAWTCGVPAGKPSPPVTVWTRTWDRILRVKGNQSKSKKSTGQGGTRLASK